MSKCIAGFSIQVHLIYFIIPVKIPLYYNCDNPEEAFDIFKTSSPSLIILPFLLFTRILLHVLFLMNFRVYLLSSMRNCIGFFIEMTLSLYSIYRKLIHLQYGISPSWSIRCLFIQKSF